MGPYQVRFLLDPHSGEGSYSGFPVSEAAARSELARLRPLVRPGGWIEIWGPEGEWVDGYIHEGETDA